jgi:hypothetical protein
MNAAAALLAAGEVPDLAAGVVRARESIDSRRALETLERLVAVSQRLGRELSGGHRSEDSAAGAGAEDASRPQASRAPGEDPERSVSAAQLTGADGGAS